MPTLWATFARYLIYMPPTRILFVCLGNICRSPLAEGLFVAEIARKGLQNTYLADSAGTNSYHTGELPDPRTRANAQSHGITLIHRARTFQYADFEAFDRVFVMDDNNLQTVLALAKTPVDRAKIALLRTYDPTPDDGQVPDPWYGGPEGFENVFQILKRTTQHLVLALEKEPARG
jgi:protein-tyrosine phosphatase